MATLLLTPTAHSQNKAARRPQTEQTGVKEMDLGTIYIEAEVEKPRVSLLPKRVRPDLSEIEFVDRSFRRELEKVPSTDLLLPVVLFQPKKIRPVGELFVKE